MERPQARMAKPARAWEYLSSEFDCILSIPRPRASTRPVMVEMVTMLKTEATISTAARLCFAAGYIIRGISGSHGPKMKIMNKIHGVMLFFSACG